MCGRTRLCWYYFARSCSARRSKVPFALGKGGLWQGEKPDGNDSRGERADIAMKGGRLSVLGHGACQMNESYECIRDTRLTVDTQNQNKVSLAVARPVYLRLGCVYAGGRIRGEAWVVQANYAIRNQNRPDHQLCQRFVAIKLNSQRLSVIRNYTANLNVRAFLRTFHHGWSTSSPRTTRLRRWLLDCVVENCKPSRPGHIRRLDSGQPSLHLTPAGLRHRSPNRLPHKDTKRWSTAGWNQIN